MPRVGQPVRNPLSVLSGNALFDEILAGIRLAGGVGQENEFLLAYIVYTGRLLPQSLGVILRGESGSGKDQIQRLPAKLMPADAVVDASNISPKALSYMGVHAVKHKVVLGGERSHDDTDKGRDSTKQIRMMLSENYVTNRTVFNNEGVALTAEGPIAYSETTTKDKIFTEDLGRCVEVWTDQSPGQTLAIMKAAAARRAGWRESKEQVDARLETYREFQASLTGHEIVIPYAPALSDLVPHTDIVSRRRFEHLLHVVEAVTLLHQHTRKPDPNGRLVSTVGDYALARRLLVGPFQSVVKLDAVSAGAFNQMPDQFTTSDLKDKMGVNEENRMTPGRRLTTMMSLGVVVQVKKPVGNAPAVWRKTGKPVDDLVLPTVETLTRLA